MILSDVGVDQNKCAEIVALNILENNNSVKYPSSLGRDLDTRSKLQLVLYLVSRGVLISDNS